MTKYIKTGITEFEQFNETNDQRFKFGIIDKANLTSVESVAYGDDRYVLSTFGKGEDMVVHPTDWIATGVNGEHWPVKDEIFKQTYKRLPVIPKYVADYIEEQKEHIVDLFEVISSCGKFEPFPMFDEAKAHIWVSGNCEDFSRAWLDGYEEADE